MRAHSPLHLSVSRPPSLSSLSLSLSLSLSPLRYPDRTALVNLDAPPPWRHPSGAAGDHLTADAARAAAGVEVTGKGAPPPAWVLTSPPAAGYAQNPISVYYVWGREGGGGRSASSGLPATPPSAALAVVTNTPWGARVAFRFDPAGDRVAKCLHVSPFMDMEGDWCVEREREREREAVSFFLPGAQPSHSLCFSLSLSPPFPRLLSASPPGPRLHVSVCVDHPDHGRFFDATLDAACDGWGGGGEDETPSPASPSNSAPRPSARSERGSLRALLSYGYMPHRTAAWIYWHAGALLLWRGVGLLSPPPRGEDERRTRGGGLRSAPGGPADARPVREGGRGHAWTPARVWPWSVQQ